MMLQVRNCKLSLLLGRVGVGLLLVSALSLASCKDKEQPVNPYIDPGTTENPNWAITVENDMSASMTAIVKVSFTDKQGTMAAFMGDACCDVTADSAYINGLYYLYITPATEAGGDVQLKFYSPDLKRIFVAKETFPFRNDSQLGSFAEPYTPTWSEAK